MGGVLKVATAGGLAPIGGPFIGVLKVATHKRGEWVGGLHGCVRGGVLVGACKAAADRQGA